MCSYIAHSRSLLGFLLGVTISGGVGYYYLLEEYNSASATLLNSVQDLQASTEKVSELQMYTWNKYL
jgi:hypothetical protein